MRSFIPAAASAFLLASSFVLAKEELLPKSSEPIAINVGRQLFVDDFLVARTDLTRAFHAAELAFDHPVLQPETPLELVSKLKDEGLPVAAPFGDGVWFDPQDQLFKMWYHAGWFDAVALATSKDGIHWERPNLDVTPGTNRVLPVREVDGHELKRDAASIWRDDTAKDAAQRWKMFVYSRQKGAPKGFPNHGELFISPDGIHWQTVAPVAFYHGDNSSIFHDPFHNLWVFSVRDSAAGLREHHSVRARFYHASKEFSGLADRPNHERAPFWLKLDQRDLPDPDLGYEPELYHFTATPYEGLMLGVFGVFYGPPNDVCAKEHRPKIIDLQLGFSRDGLVYDRPNRQAFLKCSRQPGTWNFGYLHIATGGCLVVGDKLYFYFGTWSGMAGDRRHMYAGGSTGLATLRRDGFASMDAGTQPGTLTTVPVVFRGKFPFVNVAAASGELKAEILDEAGNPLPPYMIDNSVAIRADSTRQKLEWRGAEDLSALSGKPVRFRFHLTHGQLYSFWVSEDRNGASGGYVAAGGPGLAGSRDLAR